MSTGVVLLLCSFDRIIVVCFPLGHMVYLVSCSWPHCHCHVWFVSHGADFKSNKNVVGYSHDMCATVAPVGRLCRPITPVTHRVCVWVRLMITLLLVACIAPSIPQTLDRRDEAFS